ncbi:MAG: 3'(2'),5'-bisphosphate nucleotidase CysQ family protein [Bacteroidales bacterium]
MINKNEEKLIIRLLEKAGKEILSVYHTIDFGTRMKEDKSPVTHADMISDFIIKSGLGNITPGIPVFSEETKDVSFDIRSRWDPLWILDPLDGTKEFIARNDEFCISLAMISGNKPVAGFIYSPVTFETWIAIKGKGAFRLKNGRKKRLPFVKPDQTLRVNISRSHHSRAEEEWINKIKANYDVETVIYGSAIKFCRIAEGYSDLYPKFSLIHEWDIAAGHIIVEEAGGGIIEVSTGRSPVYNKPDYYQPPFIAFGERSREIIRRELI